MKKEKDYKKYCKSLNEAENIQWELYNKYNSVVLVSYPSNSEVGLYCWKVK